MQGHRLENSAMKKDMIIRAWKDPAFRAGLSAEERAEVPECPAGSSLSELDEVSLAQAVGGNPDPDGAEPNPWLSPYVHFQFADYAQLRFNAARVQNVAALGAVYQR